MLAQINNVSHQLQNLLEYDGALKTITDLLDAAQIQLQEGVYELKHYRQRLDLDPQALHDVEQRLSSIHAAARKFRVNTEELPALLESITQQLTALGSNADIGHLLNLEAAAQSEYRQHAQQLSGIRQQAAQQLSGIV